MNAIDTVIQQWRAIGVALNPGADEKQLMELQEALGRPLPDDVKYFFSLANGMEYCESDNFMVSFWSISQVLSEQWRPSGTDKHGPFQDLGFADVIIHSWFICFRTRPGSGVTIHVEGVPIELASLQSFFQRYLDDPDSLCL